MCVTKKTTATKAGNKNINKKEIILSAFQKQCIVGHILGDGFMVKNSGKNTNARFGFAQSSKKQFYFKNVYSNFKTLCSVSNEDACFQKEINTKKFITKGVKLESLQF